MRKFLQTLKLSGSTLALSVMSMAANSALAQTNQSAPVEQVVVTGTSIQGVAPIGSNLITIGQEEINATGGVTIEQVLSDQPELTGFGQAAQGAEVGSTVFAPNIHELGSSSSNTTLTLIDGHRFPSAATSHEELDPNIVSPNMVERIEVLADGASSIYGSDAVAGVVNIITRKSFDGVQMNLQYGTGNNVDNKSADILMGKSWGDGSAMFSASYAYRGAVSVASHSRYLNQNLIPEGGTNFNTFNCNPATLQPNGSGNIFLSATDTSGGVANIAANSPCYSTEGDLEPEDVRTNVMAKLVQNFGPRLNVDAEIVFSDYNDHTFSSPGVVTATAFGTGPQANPFFVAPPGSNATKETIRYRLDGLLPEAVSRSGADYIYSDMNAEYNFNDNWRLKLLALYGWAEGYTGPNLGPCSSCINLALNGTTNSSGSLTTPSIPNTTAIITQTLTTSNALDVWDPVGSNKTSAATLAGLETGLADTRSFNLVKQIRADINGALFDLPAGPLKIALGAEYVGYGLEQSTNSPLNIGPSGSGSQEHLFNFIRNVYSAYAETEFPVISPEMAIPFVQKVEVDLSGRYDHYSDEGGTTNPKAALNWDVVDGLRVRSSWSTSFVAPPMDSVGDPRQGYIAAYSGVSLINGGFSASPALYPALVGFPGAVQSGTASTPCSASSASCVVSATQQGISFISGGGPNLHSERGHGWTLGADISPIMLPGVDAEVTWFNNTFLGGTNSPSIGFTTNSPGLAQNVTLYPGCATQAQINASIEHVPINTTLPLCTNFIFNDDQANVINLAVSGIDAAVHYQYATDNLGTFKIGDSITEFLKFHDQIGPGAPTFSVLNTTGFNSTFPSVQMSTRANVGWLYEGFDADLYVNFTGGYHNWSAYSVIPILHNAQGYPIGGGDVVKSNTTVDLHLSYELPNDILPTDISGDTQLYLTGTNIFNTAPPFYNGYSYVTTGLGYDSYVGNPVGRIISIGIRIKR